MNHDDAIARACADIPGLVRSAAVLLPDGDFLGGVGTGDFLDRESLVRAAQRCCVEPAGGPGRREHIFVFTDEFLVVQRSQTSPALALVATCTREPNLAIVRFGTRTALATLEQTLDLTYLTNGT